MVVSFRWMADILFIIKKTAHGCLFNEVNKKLLLKRILPRILCFSNKTYKLPWDPSFLPHTVYYAYYFFMLKFFKIKRFFYYIDKKCHLSLVLFTSVDNLL